MSIVRAICQPPVLPAVVGAGGNVPSVPSGPSNPFPAFEAAQTNYYYQSGGYDGPLPDPTVALATLTVVLVNNNFLTQPLPDFSAGTSIQFNFNDNATFVGNLNFALFPPTVPVLNIARTGLSSLSNVSSTQLTTLDITGSAFTTLPDIVSQTSLYDFYFTDCAITAWAGTAFDPALGYMEGIDCGMPTAVLNAILVALDAAGGTNGYADLPGNGAPTGAGLTAKTSLEGKGWTVVVDS